MKSYPNIISKLFYEPLVITPARHAAICQLLESKLASNAPAPNPDNAPEDDDEEMDQIGKVCIIPVHGTLVRYPEDLGMSECGCPLDMLDSMIDMAENDTNVSTILFDFRTPGGAVTGIPETARKILYSRKETIGFTASECCSGGLWLAAQCQKFYATQSSRVGSVGVYTLALDMSRAMQKEGMKINAISAGKYKLLGAYWKPLADDERKILQDGVDKIYSQFKQAMTSQRAVSDENFGNGLCFDGDESAEMGFTDGVVENLEEVIDGMV